jgi:hypothetical protein
LEVAKYANEASLFETGNEFRERGLDLFAKGAINLDSLGVRSGQDRRNTTVKMRFASVGG